MDLCFTRSQRPGAIWDDQNDGLVFHESLQHPVTSSGGPKRLPQVHPCASKMSPGGPNPVSWTLTITHLVIPTKSKWKECKIRQSEIGRRSSFFFVIFLGHAALAFRPLFPMEKARKVKSYVTHPLFALCKKSAFGNLPWFSLPFCYIVWDMLL